MLKKIVLNGMVISYNMQYKNVKNINLRIKPDGTIQVSANCFVGQKRIDDFLVSKSKFILDALSKCATRAGEKKTPYVSEADIQNIILCFCEKLFPYFENKGVKYPEIRFKRMISQWGNCYPGKGIVTFNTNLMYAPPDCIEYVVAHEFTHFLHPNHSQHFYNELSKIIPDWKEKRTILRKISLSEF